MLHQASSVEEMVASGSCHIRLICILSNVVSADSAHDISVVYCHDCIAVAYPSQSIVPSRLQNEHLDNYASSESWPHVGEVAGLSGAVS